MDHAFWHERWKTRDLAFHQPQAHPLLVKHLPRLSLPENSRIFVPLCGKSLDIAWLLSQGHPVAGAELVKTAVEELFQGLGIEPQIEKRGPLFLYRAPEINIFVGDIFELTKNELGPIDAVYDRGALVALPEEIRFRYTAHLNHLTGNASQLLICYEYDQSALAGPPFSITADEVRRHYGKSHELVLIERVEVEGGLRGKCVAREVVWELRRALAS